MSNVEVVSRFFVDAFTMHDDEDDVTLVRPVEMSLPAWRLTAGLTDIERHLGWAHPRPTLDEACWAIRFCPALIARRDPQGLRGEPSLSDYLLMVRVALQTEIVHLEMPLPPAELAALNRHWANQTLVLMRSPLAGTMPEEFFPEP